MKILIGIFCIIIYMDWRYYKIPNICIAAGMAAGLMATGLSCAAGGMLRAIGAAGAVFTVFYPFYLMGALGAGDVKLFMMMGCYSVQMKTDRFIQYMLVTMMIAAAFSIAKMIAYTQSRERLRYLVQYFKKAVLTGAVDSYQVDRTQKRCVVRLSLPAFISLILMCTGVYA